MTRAIASERRSNPSIERFDRLPADRGEAIGPALTYPFSVRSSLFASTLALVLAASAARADVPRPARAPTPSAIESTMQRVSLGSPHAARTRRGLPASLRFELLAAAATVELGRLDFEDPNGPLQMSGAGMGLGLALGYGGGLLAISLPFLMARLLGRNRQTPWRPKRPALRRAFDQLETHPYRSVIVLRLILWFNPPISYALAFTPIRFGAYLLACAIALAPVVIAANLATSWFV